MNWEQIKGDWTTYKGKVKERWGKLTDSEVDQINGRREQLEGTLQKEYGIAKEEARKEVDAFCKTCR